MSDVIGQACALQATQLESFYPRFIKALDAVPRGQPCAVDAAEFLAEEHFSFFTFLSLEILGRAQSGPAIAAASLGVTAQGLDGPVSIASAAASANAVKSNTYQLVQWFSAMAAGALEVQQGVIPAILALQVFRLVNCCHCDQPIATILMWPTKGPGVAKMTVSPDLLWNTTLTINSQGNTCHFNYGNKASVGISVQSNQAFTSA